MEGKNDFDVVDFETITEGITDQDREEITYPEPVIDDLTANTFALVHIIQNARLNTHYINVCKVHDVD